MYEHVREIIDDLNENVNTLNECLIEARSEYDDLKYVIADLVKDVRDGKVKQSEILGELGDRLEQYCGIYIDEEIKND